MLFAVDSIPAVLGVTSDPFVVYTSNIAAVVGLRSLYQILSVAVADLVYLERAVALVLGFVGLKLGAQVLRHGLSPATRMHPARHASASGLPPHACPGVRLRVGSNPHPHPNPDQVFGYELVLTLALTLTLTLTLTRTLTLTLTRSSATS